MQGRIKISLLAAIKQPGFQKLGSDDFAQFPEPSREQKAEQRRSEHERGGEHQTENLETLSAC